jgi:hypothetical protein
LKTFLTLSVLMRYGGFRILATLMCPVSVLWVHWSLIFKDDITDYPINKEIQTPHGRQ